MNLGQQRIRGRTRAKISLLVWFTSLLVVGALWLISSGAETWKGLSAQTFLFLGPFLFLPFSLVGLVFALFAIRGSERPILWILGVSLNGLSVAAAATLLILRSS